MKNLSEALEAFVELGADIEHDRWARWQKHMFSKGTVDENGVFHLPKEFVDRWFLQIDTKYADLSEPEKESDRKETRNYIPIIKSTLISLLDEVVMEEKDTGTFGDRDEHYKRIGYNDCRQELIKKINDIKK